MLKFKYTLLFLLIGWLFCSTVYADIGAWDKGITLHLNNQSASQIDIGLSEIKAVGADYVTFSPGWITDSTTSSNVDRKLNTSTDATLIYAVTRAHALGLKVMLKPHLDISGGIWRANLNPTNKTLFFQNYSSMLTNYAKLAQQTNVEQFSIGAELVFLTTNPENTVAWRQLISNIRTVYKGSLTYSANADSNYKFDEFKRLTFWNDLDVAGISFYGQVANNFNPTQSELRSAWANWEQNYILPTYKLVNKPLFFSEIGYRSVNGAGQRPWDFTYNNTVDPAEQNELYTAFFDYWKQSTYITGVNFWEWELAAIDPALNKDYTPQSKTAENTIKKYFLNTATTPQTGAISELNRYTLDTLLSGSTYYSDRPYLITNLPVELSGEKFIKTRNADKNQTVQNFLSFKLVEPSYLYIGYDSRARIIPAWLAGFTKTSQLIKTTDTSLNVYVKYFNPGSVTLGGNLSIPAKGAKSNYIVVVTAKPLITKVLEPLPTIPLSVVTPTTALTNEVTIQPSAVLDPLPTATLSPPVTNVLPSSKLPTNTYELFIHTPEINKDMSGEKKLKAYIPNLDLDEYTAEYSVDNYPWVLMSDDSTQSYKQAKVDFDNWTWNSKGPYTITVKAKWQNGEIIDSATTDVFIK